MGTYLPTSFYMITRPAQSRYCGSEMDTHSFSNSDGSLVCHVCPLGGDDREKIRVVTYVQQRWILHRLVVDLVVTTREPVSMSAAVQP